MLNLVIHLWGTIHISLCDPDTLTDNKGISDQTISLEKQKYLLSMSVDASIAESSNVLHHI